MPTMLIPCPDPRSTHSQLYLDVFASPKTFLATLATPDAQFATEMAAQLTACAVHYRDALTASGATELPALDLIEHKLFHELVAHLEQAAAFLVVLALIGDCTEHEARRATERYAHMQHLLAEQCALRAVDTTTVQ